MAYDRIHSVYWLLYAYIYERYRH